MITYNSEIKAIIEENGGKIVYSSGNILIASDISLELARQLSLHSDYIEDITILPLKPLQKNYTPVDLTSVGVAENQEGGGTITSGTPAGGGA